MVTGLDERADGDCGCYVDENYELQWCRECLEDTLVAVERGLQRAREQSEQLAAERHQRNSGQQSGLW